MNKKELKRNIKNDKYTFFKSVKSYYQNKLIRSHSYMYMKNIIYYRKMNYYKNKVLNKNYLYLFLYLFYSRLCNKLSRINNIYLQGDFGINIIIYHHGVVINQKAKLGNNIIFHGNNCVGNDGKDLNNCPKIGNNVEFGYGSSVIGNVSIADNVIIGAHTLVNKSIIEKGSIVVGCPGRIINKK